MLRLPIPDDFHLHATKMNVELEKMYGRNKATITKWRRALGITQQHGGPRPMPPPEDWAEIAPTLSLMKLAKHYDRSAATIVRWSRETGIKYPKEPRSDRGTRKVRNYIVQVKKKPVPDDWAEKAAELHLAELCRHYGCSDKLIQRWSKETGIAPAIRPDRRPGYRGKTQEFKRAAAPKRQNFSNYRVTPAVNRPAPRQSGRDAEAAEYLRRWFPNVYRSTNQGSFDLKGKFWRIGNAVLTVDELLERAARKGWDPKAWERLVA